MRQEPGEASCYVLLREVRWPDGIACPHCGQCRVTTHSKSTRSPRRRYLCLECRRTFTDLTGTPLARTNLPLVTWFRCLRLLGRGQGTSELARTLGVKWDTTASLERRLGLALRRPGLIQRLREILMEQG